ncbi:MAG: FliI/YscN family ATPase [Bdellovibrionota bacterium]|jgi:flagellum-specific ATP synthase
MGSLLTEANAAMKLASNYELRGKVSDVTGLVIEGTGPFVSVGSQVSIRSGGHIIQAQVVGFRQDKVLLMPYAEPQGLASGAIITATGDSSDVVVLDSLCGKVIDAMGNPIDGSTLDEVGTLVPLYRDPPNPITRTRIKEPFDLGVKAINTILTVGKGQRVGIMSGSGVGKSTLLGMFAKHSTSDINVIGLVGERGREVREFIERDLGPEGLKRSVVVVATGNESALMRIRAAFLATTIAEYFRDQGKQVVLMIDSITRLAMAQREVGLAIGEPPSTRGYTPSVFAMLPKVLERAGTAEKGSITGLYTVLVEGDDMNEPIADAVRGILDGHIILDRKLAAKGQFPAISVLDSVSRVMSEIVPNGVLDLAALARDLLATYRDNEDLITIGAYKRGQNPKVDLAVSLNDKLIEFLKQKPGERFGIKESWELLAKILEEGVKEESVKEEGE